MLIADPMLTIENLARKEDLAPRYLDRIVRLRFLSPRIADQIANETQKVGVDLARLTSVPLPLDWDEQARTLIDG